MAEKKKRVGKDELYGMISRKTGRPKTIIREILETVPDVVLDCLANDQEVIFYETAVIFKKDPYTKKVMVVQNLGKPPVTKLFPPRVGVRVSKKYNEELQKRLEEKE